MGITARTGRRDNGSDRLARLMRAPERPPNAHLDADTSDEGLVDEPTVADRAARWGATAMPDWLDSPDGRRAWEDRAEPQFECLDDDLDHELHDHRRERDDRDRDDQDRDDRDRDDRDRDDRDRDDRDWDDQDWDDEDEWVEPRVRWTMLPRAAIGLVAVGLCAIAFAGYTLLRENEPVAPLVAFEQPAESNPLPPQSSAAGPVPITPPRAASTPASELVVSVVGLVGKPGLVHLPERSRVADALHRAGGAREGADLLSLNLAQLLRDGDQVLVGRRGGGQVRSAVVPSGGTGTSGPAKSEGGGTDSKPSGASVNLNTATEAELDALPGVGPVTAQAIIAWRSANGQFSSVDQLADVDGIGPGRLAKLRPLVTVG